MLVQWPQDLADTRFDLLVVGGGINGAGIARDAALRGLKVLLVDGQDWGWATSAKSSKLAHGGVRYLEQFEFGLVHEALQDRERMLAQAPHLVRPLQFLYPIYPHVAARRTVRVGLWLYDLLSHGKSVPKRRYYKREAALRLAPGLNPDGLTGGATYYDGQIQWVERLVAELVWDAKQHGAVCLNHTRVEALTVEDYHPPDEGLVGQPRRHVTGATLVGPDGQEVQVHAATTVNAAGTWVDQVLGEVGRGKPAKVRCTKGVHVVVPRFVDTALIVKAASDGRTFFLIPWLDTCVIGTTDTDFQGDAGDAAATNEDVDYLLDEARRYFPQAPLDRADVRYTYAGVRALVNQEGLTESNVTRRHILYDHEKRDGVRGLWSLQGGKITTYRTLAEEAVKQVCERAGRRDLAKLRPTRSGTLPGGPLVPWDEFRAAAVAAAQSEYQVPPASAEHLLDVYGARWRQVLDSDTRPEARRRLHRRHPHLACEVTYAVRQEDALTVADVMLRRTDLGLAKDGNPGAAARVASWMADLLEWDAETREAMMDDHLHQARVLALPGEETSAGAGTGSGAGGPRARGGTEASPHARAPDAKA